MEERDILSINYKQKKKILADMMKKRRRRRNRKSHRLIFLYIFILLIILLLLMTILFLFPEKNRLDKKIFVYNKDNKEIDINKDIYAKISKKSFQYKIDEFEYENLEEIHISYSLDNNLIYPTLVSMASGLENNNNNKNIIVYHLLFSHDFDTSKVEIFESLRKNYTVKINYYVIPPFFKNLNPWTAGTDCVYYKIILPIMFPDYKRIIYLDGDTLIRKDISEMFNLPFNGNYILGFPFYMGQVMDEFGINDKWGMFII